MGSFHAGAVADLLKRQKYIYAVNSSLGPVKEN